MKYNQLSIFENIFDVSPYKDIDEEVDKLFIFFREHGFPNYEFNSYNKKKEIEKIINFNEKKIFQEKDIKQTMHSLGFLWCFFPHWIEVKCNSAKKSLLELWEDDRELKKLIKKTYTWQLKYGNGVFTINRLRQNAKVYLSKQSVSNFRPTAAKYFYNEYGNNGVVWDMCAGWGGRLFGFLSSNCHTYIGTEPSTKTFNGLIDLKNEYSYLDKKVILSKQGAEDITPPKNSLDLCFTSPPYFDCEKYSDEETQSYKKYPTKELWLNGFFRKMIKKCYYGLKKNCYLIINIANTTKYDWIENETKAICQEEGFMLDDTNYLILSSISGKGIKREPIFIYKKL